MLRVELHLLFLLKIILNCKIREILCALFPGVQVLHLFGGQRIDLDAHGFQLQAGDLAVDFVRNGVDLLLQACRRS